MNSELNQSTQQNDNCVILDRQGYKQFINQLNVARAGLSYHEIPCSQDDCFVFKDGYIFTYDLNILCAVECNVPIEGAVCAKPFLQQLKLVDDWEISIELYDDSLVLARGLSQIRFDLEKEILLPMDHVPDPGLWNPLPKELADAVENVAPCADKDLDPFGIGCIHVTKNFIEACDNYQLCRYTIETGIEPNILIVAKDLAKIAKHKMTQFSITAKWIHFRNDEGVRMTCSCYTKDDVNFDPLYPCLDSIIGDDNKFLTIPKELVQAVSRAPVFTKASERKDEVRIDIKGKTLKVSGEGVFGYHEENFDLDEHVTDFSFKISPAMITWLAKKQKCCELSRDRLRIDADSYVFIASLCQDEDDG